MSERTVRLAVWCRENGVSVETARQLIARGELRAHKLNPAKTNSPYLVSPSAARAFDRARGIAA